MLRVSPAAAVIAALLGATGAFAVDADRDFSGTWILDAPSAGASSVRPVPPSLMTVTQTDASIECSSADTKWVYALDGSDHATTIGGQTWSSVAKWEGRALLVNTLVSGPENYTVMDRWEMSTRNRGLLVVTRQTMHGAARSEGQFFYHREEAAAATETSGLMRRPETAPDTEFVIPAGTRVLLELVNQVDTRHTQGGDRAYLRTAFPVYASNHLVIPQGATVMGTVTEVKKPGKVQGRGELYIRFDSLTLPNGVTRDFRSRLGSASGAKGTVDAEEGRVTSPSGAGEEARGAAGGGAVGAGIGSRVGAAAGHVGSGAAMGGAIGAAAGLGVVLAKGRPDAVLPKGSNLEMILDRDLRYRADELH